VSISLKKPPENCYWGNFRLKKGRENAGLKHMLLGPVYLLGLFLQQFVDSLYKAELMPCRYSTSISDNAVERSYKCCLKGSAKSVLRFVARYLHRMTKLTTSRRD